MLLSLARTIRPIVARTVAVEFSADRAAVTARQARDLGIRATLLPENGKVYLSLGVIC